MSQVSLRICGRDYAVSCADGEEAHVHTLGNLIEEKLDSLPSSTAQNEVRTMLFAALLLATTPLAAHAKAPTALKTEAAALIDGNAKLDYAFVTDRVTNGQGAMPSFGGQMSDEEIDIIAKYVVMAKK